MVKLILVVYKLEGQYLFTIFSPDNLKFDPPGEIFRVEENVQGADLTSLRNKAKEEAALHNITKIIGLE